jgi:hypothetical protein
MTETETVSETNAILTGLFAQEDFIKTTGVFHLDVMRPKTHMCCQNRLTSTLQIIMFTNFPNRRT